MQTIPFDEPPDLFPGDRVVQESLGERKIGTVIRSYRSVPDAQGQAYTLYEVRWDSVGYPQKGHFRRYLSPLTPIAAV
jgi:hypothetical protein